MEKDWNIRLKQKRQDAGLTLKTVSAKSKRGLTQQSLIAYEKGTTLPRIDVLDDLCKIYGCNINYILYGSNGSNLILGGGDCLVAIWYLLVTNKMAFDGDHFYIIDEDLRTNSSYLSLFINNHDISSVEDLYALIEGAKNMEANN